VPRRLQPYLRKSRPARLARLASRKQQKEAARLAREQAVAQLKTGQQRRVRLMTLGGVLLVVVAVAAVLIIISSAGGGSSASEVSTQRDGAYYSHAGALAEVKSLLSGIPESGNVLGNPLAPVTITEFGDLVCPVCDLFAVTTEPQLIQSEVRTGKVQLQFRGYVTASGRANASEYVPSQVAARSAGLQDKEWYYVLLLYDEQPQNISGQDAELVKYVTPAYLRNRAQQVPGLDVAAWSRHLHDQALINDVSGDGAAAQHDGITGTPTILVSGPKGTVEYDRGGTENSVIPTVAQIRSLIAQVR